MERMGDSDGISPYILLGFLHYAKEKRERSVIMKTHVKQCVISFAMPTADR